MLRSIRSIWQSVDRKMKASSLRRRSRTGNAHALESRTLLASLVSATKLTYQDADGDNVTVTLSKAVLTAGNVNSIFTFDVGTVDGSNTTKQQLRTINLVGVAGIAGTTITTAAVRSAANGGDGFAALGQIIATGIDVGAVTIDGDLGRILAGDATTTTQGLGALKVHSMGRYGTLSGATNLETVIQGKLASLTTKSDVIGADILVQGGSKGQIGLVTIGGSLVGGTSFFSGSIRSLGDIGPVKITGDILGGTGVASGNIRSFAKIGSVTIGGSIRGWSGSNGGRLESTSDMGEVKIAGDVHGDNSGTGLIYSGANLASVTIGGSLIGHETESGLILSIGNMGAVKITGNVQGGPVELGQGNSGYIQSSGKISSVAIGGSIIGTRTRSGRISAAGELTTLTIGGNIIGGSRDGSIGVEMSGYVEAERIGTLTLNGSLIAGTDETTGFYRNNGAIRVDYDIANLTIKGSIVGNSTNLALITTGGKATPSGTSDLAIGKLTINGRVEYGLIVAGSTADDEITSANADAQIGPVIVGGDWIASSLIAGAAPGVDGLYGTADDVKMSGGTVKDVSTVSSKISSIVIGGQVMGTPVLVGDHFGFVAENIGSFKVKGGTTTYSLTAGNSNDDILLSLVFGGLLGGDTRLNEI